MFNCFALTVLHFKAFSIPASSKTFRGNKATTCMEVRGASPQLGIKIIVTGAAFLNLFRWEPAPHILSSTEAPLSALTYTIVDREQYAVPSLVFPPTDFAFQIPWNRNHTTHGALLHLNSKTWWCLLHGVSSSDTNMKQIIQNANQIKVNNAGTRNDEDSVTGRSSKTNRPRAKKVSWRGLIQPFLMMKKQQRVDGDKNTHHIASGSIIKSYYQRDKPLHSIWPTLFSF